MPAQVLSSVENSFTKGLVTEFTGLNFPENAATDTDNCTYTLVGNVTRRLGIDYEANFGLTVVDRARHAMSSYVWNNAGGDGNSQLKVEQIGNILNFFNISSSTVTSPLSTHRIASQIFLTSFTASGAILDETLECTYSSGDGYLFIYHPNCDPIYCSYVSGAVAGNRITVKVRDFTGVNDGLASNLRPATLSTTHQYNLTNQGWVAGNAWATTSTATITAGLGSKTFTAVGSGITLTLGDVVTIATQANPSFPGDPPKGTPMMTGTITAYAGTTMTVNVTSGATAWFGSYSSSSWSITPVSSGYIAAWNSAIGNYPSNADVWWYFKDNTGAFLPATTISHVTLGNSKAPRGHYVFPAFEQNRQPASGLSIANVSTVKRPRLGTWFQGRVWFAGCDAQQAATTDTYAYTWTENIYFSQAIFNPDDFGNCYQVNDPTSELLFDILPTDGGVIRIQGCGSIFKLFPIQNGLLVFAAKGIWFITGSQGIGFTANDYTITKISSVQSISSTSFVDVLGLPYFWNEEGIYSVQPSKGGGLTVDTITVGTILSFYDDIPHSSKQYVKGAYHPVDYVIQWVYKDTEATDVTDRYQYNRILNFNTYNKAFFPYSVSISSTSINGIDYVSPPGGLNSILPGFKYTATALQTSGSSYNLTFADEHDDEYVDWDSSVTADYSSYFISGYKLHGQGQRRFQIPYLYVFSNSELPTSYKIQGIWDYAVSGNSGRWSTAQLVNNWSPNFGAIFRRHRIRGQGLVLQFKIKSVSGQPFDILGWSTFEMMNQGV